MATIHDYGCFMCPILLPAARNPIKFSRHGLLDGYPSHAHADIPLHIFHLPKCGSGEKSVFQMIADTFPFLQTLTISWITRLLSIREWSGRGHPYPSVWQHHSTPETATLYVSFTNKRAKEITQEAILRLFCQIEQLSSGPLQYWSVKRQDLQCDVFQWLHIHLLHLKMKERGAG